ncbi:MAG TPA: CPBP family intramembrane glutamic endopeptidase [Bacteroidia bacterium]|nr:CPBP family intramembrane glutamic endopeptidase [Bacteroidia bacterium]
MGIFADKPPYRKFLILVSLVLFSTLVFSMIGMLLARYLYGIDLLTNETLLNDLENPVVLAAMKMLQMVTSGIGMFLLPALFAAIVFDKKPVAYLQLNKRAPAPVQFLTVLLMFSAVPVINALLVFNQAMQLPSFLSGLENWMKTSEENAAVVTEAFLKMKTPVDLVQNLIIVAVLPALGEEFLFRGIIQRLFTDLTGKPVTAILLSAALFSALHLQFYGFLPRFALGILFGFLLIWSGSIWLPVLAHFVNNGAAVLMAWFNRNDALGFNQDTIGTAPGEWVYTLLSAGVVILLCMLINKMLPKPETVPDLE